MIYLKESIKYLKNLLKFNDKVVIACSAGPDSMYLMHLLEALKKELNLTIICAHVNHKLRSQSEDEYQFLKEYCAQSNIIFEYYEILHYDDDNFHNTSHKLRYTFFEQVVNKYQANYLFTAHHGDDLIETILMKLTRGTSFFSYKGFDIISSKNNYKIVRPLIFLTKQEIKNYMDKNNLKYYIDNSNFSDHYTRNRYRKYVLPFLKSENIDVHKKYLEFSFELAECQDYVIDIVNKLMQKYFVDNILFIDKLQHEKDFIIKQCLHQILKNVYTNNSYLSKKYVNEILAMIKSSKPNLTLNLSQGLVASKEYNKIKFIKNMKNSSYYHVLKDEVTLHSLGKIEIVSNATLKDNNYIYLNSHEIELPLIIRSRKSGDKMLVKNLNGHKKIKDIFIDEKIPQSKRKIYPIVTDSGNNILWLPGLKKSKFDHANDRNYDIILKYTKKEGENHNESK